VVAAAPKGAAGFLHCPIYTANMGFALWVKDDVARAEGTHEYRAMGIAVVSVTGQFLARDFRPRHKYSSVDERDFAGFFASLGDLNYFLSRRFGASVNRASKRRRRESSLREAG